MSYVTHLESALDGSLHPARRLATTHAGRPLLVRYDLPAVGRILSPAVLAGRPPTLWRYRELLPVEREQDVVSLGETMTPLLASPRLAAELGLRALLVKDESRLPTGSFKARGMAVAVSLARALGARTLVIPTAGNAGGALAAYAARAGLPCVVLMPQDTPIVNQREAALLGAHVFLVDGLIHECGALVRECAARLQWFDMSTLKEPYRLEGKKTMGLELAEQLDWRLPDAIFYPTGGGTGLLGMAKAFEELAALGWLADEVRPRLYACQSSGCAPLVTAWEAGQRFATPPPAPFTAASGLRVPAAIGDFMILDAVRESGGAVLAAEEAGLRGWQEWGARAEGISFCPETAIALGALRDAAARGLVGGDDTVVLWNTGAAQKSVEALAGELPRLSRAAPDWDLLAGLA